MSSGGSAGIAVSVQGVSKRFRLYHERNQSLKAAVMRRGRARYEEFWALRDVSLQIPAGVTYGLIGENGSGKSTLLKCIARILRPDAGRVVTDGKVAALLELGSGFHPELSGRENVFLNGSILGLSRSQITRRFDDIVGFAGLERFIDTPVKNYSSGMYVRLGFSVAINVDPDILLVDEVLAVGDESFQRRCAEKFSDFRRSGRTIVLVSHALGQLRNLCDEVAWLEHGRVKESGAPGNVVDDYVGESHHERAATGAAGSADSAAGADSADGADGAGTAERNRWGSGEATITEVELLDPDGRPTTSVRTGDRVTVRLHYATREPVERPVFGIAVHSLDGVEVTGPNTRDADVVPDKIDGPGVVDLQVPRLLLLPGRYDLSGAVYDYSRTHPYDHRHRVYRFDVEAGSPREEHGFTSLGGSWRLDEPGGAS